MTPAALGTSAVVQATRVLNATSRRYIKRQSAYLIEIIRWPLFPLIYFSALYLTYSISDRTEVAGYSVEGFLLVGVIGTVLWTSNLWASGYAIEYERREGTLEALFLAPASRTAVVFGYGLGSMFVLVVPTSAALICIALLMGIEFHIASYTAAALAILGILFASAALGYVLAGFFVLTRRANMLANFLQSPIYLLSGAFIPVVDLPESLHFFSRLFPLSYGMDMTRNSLLAGANVSQILPDLTAIAVSSLVLIVIGYLFLGKVEQHARNGAELDFE